MGVLVLQRGNSHSCTCMEGYIGHHCETKVLPVHGGYSEWGDWSTCSTTCGEGQKVKRRTCTNPPPSNGGNDCSKLSRVGLEKIKSCKIKDCLAVEEAMKAR